MDARPAHQPPARNAKQLLAEWSSKIRLPGEGAEDAAPQNGGTDGSLPHAASTAVGATATRATAPPNTWAQSRYTAAPGEDHGSTVSRIMAGMLQAANAASRLDYLPLPPDGAGAGAATGAATGAGGGDAIASITGELDGRHEKAKQVRSKRRNEYASAERRRQEDREKKQAAKARRAAEREAHKIKQAKEQKLIVSRTSHCVWRARFAGSPKAAPHVKGQSMRPAVLVVSLLPSCRSLTLRFLLTCGVLRVLRVLRGG